MNLLVFDSGIGGLGVVREIRRLQPGAKITYLADNGFFPYGEKPDAVLLPHIVELIGRAIARFAPSAVVVACNTASTIALGALRAAYGTPFIGCVPPIKPAAAASRSRHIGVLATAATVRRSYLKELISTFAQDCAVHSLGTPSLAELAEQKFRGEKVDVAGAIAPLFARQGAAAIDAIALGCTHYTFLLPEFEALYPEIAWFDPALPVARQTFAVTQGFENAGEKNVAYFTACLPDFERMQERLEEFGFEEVGQGFALHP
jgi:glutamate racemase